jgi:hypothetical protein
MSNMQTRAIVGDRHFVLVDERNKNVYAQPGQVVTGGEIISGQEVRVFAQRTITLAQLQAWAIKRGERLVVNDKFPLVRAAYGQD